jgi:hypothetical protein
MVLVLIPLEMWRQISDALPYLQPENKNVHWFWTSVAGYPDAR